MKIVKPYGRSVIEAGDFKQRKIIATKETEAKSIDKIFIKDEAVIASWISVIDKIIVKPFEKDGKGKRLKESAVLLEAQKYRKWLGDAAWELMKVDFLLSVFRAGEYKTEEERAKKEKYLKEVWDKKIKAVQKGKIKRSDFPKGRWYESFVPVPIDKFSPSLAESVAGRIGRHIDESARKIVVLDKYAQRKNSKGIMKNYKRSFENNTLQNAQDKAAVSINRAMWESYAAKAGENIAALIKNRILQEQSKQGDKEKNYNLAVEILRNKVWPAVFNNARTYETALKLEGGDKLLAVHNAVKELYKWLLKGRSFFVEKQKPLVSGQTDWQEKIQKLVCEKLGEVLPSDNNALFRHIGYKEQNRDISKLIRLGKIIHYEASRLSNEYENRGSGENGKDVAAVKDSPVAIIAHWGDATKGLAQSPYWSSQGQTYIKQSEAFVRIWRRALAFAAHNIRDWAENPDNKLGAGKDILFAKDKETKEYTVLKNYSEKTSGQKFELLFADEKLQSSQKELLKVALDGVAELRNAAFHFKGLKKFVDALEGRESCKDAEIEELLLERYEYHSQKFQDRLKESLITIGLPDYIGIGDANKLWHHIRGDNTSLLPLPRLRRVLERAEKAWKGDKQGKTNDGETIALDGKNLMPEIKLPEYVSAQEREEDKGEHCQWSVLKLLYDGDFKAWLDRLSHTDLQNYIDHAVARATWAARTLNRKDNKGGVKSPEELVLTVAKSDRLKNLQEGDTIESFFYYLTGETASEMRVQRGYDSNGPQAQLQAKYIEDLKCDVVALAFACYLKKEELSFVLDIGKTENPEPWKTDRLPKAELQEVDTWQAKLYFLLHLMPIEEATSLRQQIRKYQIVVQKTAELGAVQDKDRAHLKSGDEKTTASKTASKLVRVLDLYVLMHDAQYVDNEKTGIPFTDEEKTVFFVNPSDFRKPFPESTKEQGETAAIRDLRELRRFGGFELLKKQTFDRITSENVADWKNITAEVEGKDGDHKKLNALHDDWKKHRKEPQWAPAYKDKQTGRLVEAGEKYAQYDKLLKKVAETYRHLNNQIMLQDHLRLHRLLMAVIGRLIDFSGLWERDLYFTMLALLYKNEAKNLEDQFADIQVNMSIMALPVKQQEEAWHKEREKGLLGSSFLEKGQIVAAFCKLKDEAVKGDLTKWLGITGKEEGNTKAEKIENLFKTDKIQWIRNRFAHLAMLEKENLPLNLTREVNSARQLMSYDRKLKNAVSKSVIELLAREKLKLEWKICVCAESGLHNLSKTKLESELDYHLKKTKTSTSKVCVKHYGDSYVEMVQNLFKPVEPA